MMRWRPWPHLVSRKFEVRLEVRRLEAPLLDDAAAGARPGAWRSGAVAAEVVWKGPKAPLGSLRRPSVRRNCTRVAAVVERLSEEGDGAVGGAKTVSVAEWNEEFYSVCCLTAHKENDYHPWEVVFSIYDANENHGLRNKMSVIGTAMINLAVAASLPEEKEIELNIPLSMPGASSVPSPSLYLSLSLLEFQTTQVSLETAQRCIVPVPLTPTSRDDIPPEKDELSAIKAGLRKVKILTDLVSSRKSRKTCMEDEDSEGMCSAQSEDTEYNYLFDSGSQDDDHQEGDLDDERENSIIRKSFNYGTLASVNYVDRSFYSEMRIHGGYEGWICYDHYTSDVSCLHANYMSSSSAEESQQTSKRSILPWKRKLSFRSPKARGEPLLKKAYGEEGGDDIDFDRRQLSSSGDPMCWQGMVDDIAASHLYVSQFGDDNFAVGGWETREILSRDGLLKLCTEVFFASIDQRSERAAGQSACTVLVAVIADWFHSNKGTMPIKSQFDSLIREGSLEWRNLCENATYRERFPDKHFDLETILQTKIRPLSVAPGKSFVGFFDPKLADEDDSMFDFLHGAMSFDSIWDEISRAGSQGPSPDASQNTYIVSWNDHFFVLKVDSEAYYILDTLGERLYEGCNQAYILKFDENTTIHRMSSVGDRTAGERGEPGNQAREFPPACSGVQGNIDEERGAIVYGGKEACKEYIKSFLAAIPVRELQADVRKGLVASTPIHHRLQIEFHYTEPSEQSVAAPPPAVGGAVTSLSFHSWRSSPHASICSPSTFKCRFCRPGSHIDCLCPGEVRNRAV